MRIVQSQAQMQGTLRRCGSADATNQFVGVEHFRFCLQFSNLSCPCCQKSSRECRMTKKMSERGEYFPTENLLGKQSVEDRFCILFVYSLVVVTTMDVQNFQDD